LFLFFFVGYLFGFRDYFFDSCPLFAFFLCLRGSPVGFFSCISGVIFIHVSAPLFRSAIASASVSGFVAFLDER
jgi:hypothetical protein